MRTSTVLLAALLLASPAWADDLQSWPDKQPQRLSARAEPIQVINLWATWCKPCRKEMPAMSSWYQAQQKKQHSLKAGMVGIALDEPANIARFLQKTPVHYPIWRYTGKDSRAWMGSLGNNIGGLPFTLVEAKACGHREAIFGEVTAEKLDKAVAAARKACSRKG